MNRSGWPIGLTPSPPPMNRSGKCENFLLWFFTLVYDYIWPKTILKRSAWPLFHSFFLMTSLMPTCTSSLSLYCAKSAQLPIVVENVPPRISLTWMLKKSLFFLNFFPHPLLHVIPWREFSNKTASSPRREDPPFCCKKTLSQSEAINQTSKGPVKTLIP